MMRRLLLGSWIVTLAATSAAAVPPERITLGRVQDAPPQRIDLTLPAARAESAPSERMGAALPGSEPERRSPGLNMRNVAHAVAPALVGRLVSPLTRRTHSEIRKGEKSGQLSKREARELRGMNNAVALSAWSAAADGRVTDYEARDVQGHAEAISSYVFERRFAPKVPDVTWPKDDKGRK